MTQSAIKITGNRVRFYRKQRGLSQSELAQGICTQATISLIEMRDKVPNMNTLVKMAERLEVALEDIVITREDRVERTLKEATELFKQHREVDVLNLLDELNQNQFTDAMNMKRYNCLRGMASLHVEGRSDDAIFCFARVLSPIVGAESDAYVALATVGLAQAYAMRGELDRTRLYIDDAQTAFQTLDFSKQRHVDIELLLRCEIARCQAELGRFESALAEVERGVATGASADRLYMLDELLALRSTCQSQLGNGTAADQDWQTARVLATIMNNDRLVNQLTVPNTEREEA